MDTDGSDATEVPPATSSKIPEKKSQHANSRHTLSPWRVDPEAVKKEELESEVCSPFPLHQQSAITNVTAAGVMIILIISSPRPDRVPDQVPQV